MRDDKEATIRIGISVIIVSCFIGVILNLTNIVLNDELNTLEDGINQVKVETGDDTLVRSYTETRPAKDTSRYDNHNLINVDLDFKFDLSLLSVGLFSSAIPLLMYKDKIRSFISYKTRKRKKYDIIIDNNKE